MKVKKETCIANPVLIKCVLALNLEFTLYNKKFKKKENQFLKHSRTHSE